MGMIYGKIMMDGKMGMGREWGWVNMNGQIQEMI
jgi:hypothetical protein